MREDTPAALDGAGTEDPAGGVQVSLRRREIARYYALAGVILGMSATVGIVPAWTTPGTTQVT
jgi:hypothetical protein